MIQSCPKKTFQSLYTSRSCCTAVMAMVDFTAIYRLARTFDVMIEDLVEILEE
jgi:hypothetical protein